MHDYAHAVYQSTFCVTSRKRLLTNDGQGNALCHLVREIVELVCY